MRSQKLPSKETNISSKLRDWQNCLVCKFFGVNIILAMIKGKGNEVRNDVHGLKI